MLSVLALFELSEVRIMEGLAQIPIGSIVTIHGLVSMPELNGRKGKISSFVEETGRYGVQVVDCVIMRSEEHPEPYRGTTYEPAIAMKKQNFTVWMPGKADTDIDAPVTRKEAAEEFRLMSSANRTDPSSNQTLVAKKEAHLPPTAQSSFSWSNLEHGCCPMCAINFPSRSEKKFRYSDLVFCRPDYDIECKTYEWFLSNDLDQRSDCFMVCRKCGGKEKALPAPWGRGPPLPPRSPEEQEAEEDDEDDWVDEEDEEEEDDENDWADEEEDEAGEDVIVRGNTFYCTICTQDVCPVNAAGDRVSKHIDSEAHCTMKIARNIFGDRWGKDQDDEDYNDDGYGGYDDEYDGGDAAMTRSLQFERALADMQYKKSKPASASGLVVDGK